MMKKWWAVVGGQEGSMLIESSLVLAIITAIATAGIVTPFLAFPWQ